MRKLHFSLFALLIVFAFRTTANNDGPCGAQNIGQLPFPGTCPNSSYGLATVVQGSTMNATVEPLSYALQSCSGGGNISNLSPDVWFKFKASAEHVLIQVQANSSQQMIQPGISLFQANNDRCNNLFPMDCSIGMLGAASLNFNGLIPGLEYYIQIRGCASATDKGDFDLIVQNGNDCVACLQDAYVAMVPYPVNGFYPQNQYVTFFYAIRGYRPVQGNHLKAVKINFSLAWDTTGMSTSVIPSATASGQGSWKWVGSYGGFVYDADNDGSFMDGGDTSSVVSIWLFSFTVKTKACGGPANLDIDIKNLSQEEYHGTGFACSLDPLVRFKSVLNCCNVQTPPIPTQSSCMTSCDGMITTYGTSTNIQDYPMAASITSGAGLVQSSGSIGFPGNSYVDSNLCRMNYNVFVKQAGANGCIDARHVAISGPVEYFLVQTEIGCASACINKATAVLLNTPPSGYTFKWFDAQNNLVLTGTNPNNLCDGLHTMVLDHSGACPDFVDSIYLFSLPNSNPTVSYPNEICNAPGTSVTPYVESPGGVFFAAGLTIDAQNGTIYLGSGINSGQYTMYYTTPAPCFATSTNTITIVDNYNATFNYATSPLCKATQDIETPYIISGGGQFNYTPLTLGAVLVIDTLSGKIFVDQSDEGTYLLTYTIPDPVCFGFFADTITIVNDCAPPTNGTVVYNGFSPNNDGYNDAWVIDGIEDKPNRVRIFNRYGSLVFDVMDYNNTTVKFDGRDKNGTLLPSGTYFYVIDYLETDSSDKAWLEILD